MKSKQDARQEYIKNVNKAYEELADQKDVVYCHDIVKKTKYPNYVVYTCLSALGLDKKVQIRNKIKEPKDVEKVYEYIRSFFSEYHTSPALREISDGVGVPLTRLYTIIQYLAVKERIAYFLNERKTIRILS